MKRKLTEYAAITLKGCAMGAADVVPGVSGGTIAFISGVYEELIESIRSVDIEAIKMLFRFQIVQFWKKINGNFLLALFCGIAISILSLAKVMTYLLSNHPIMVWSFFFGLIIASALLIFKQIEKRTPLSLLAAIVGAIVAYLITTMSPAETPNDWWFIVICGAIAICAMILPGVSGSFILLIMGKYLYILNALSTLDIQTIALFISGAIIGIISFSHLLSWLLKNFHTATLSLLMGFMVGSLNKVWPWKEVVTTTLNSHGEVVPLVERSILPSQYEALNSSPSMVLFATLMAIVGFLTIYVIERIGRRKASN
ncbi:MAG: DUF368 domain-containing protein [Rikenellaceae bacterium]